MRLAVLDVIRLRFGGSALLEEVQSPIDRINDEQTLHRLLGMVVVLQQPEELASAIAQCIKDMPQSSAPVHKEEGRE